MTPGVAARADAGLDRPLVSFTLYAYNQEDCVREAVESALAQTYSPLEIILSDDCSRDRTFEIMQEMAAAYRGPHRVVARKSAVNRGLLRHINDVVQIAQGEIIVYAAGDDISLPERTAEHVAIYTRWPETYAVCSDYFTMSEIPVPFAEQTERGVREFTLLRHMSNAGGWGAGATYSYRRKCYEWPVPVPDQFEYEDRTLPTSAALLGRVAFMKAKLIRYTTPGETGQLEAKRRWLQRKALGPVVAHVRFILKTAVEEGKIGNLTRVMALVALQMGFWEVTVENAPASDAGRRIRVILSKLIGAPSAFILRIQRFFDFYAPILRRPRG